MNKNKQWTICCENPCGQFYITNIVFEDVARAAAKGIEAECKDIHCKVFFAANN